jgi:hypothetical protein
LPTPLPRESHLRVDHRRKVAPGGFGLPEEKNEHRFARCLHYGSLRVLEYHRLQTAALAGQEVNGQEAGRGMK